MQGVSFRIVYICIEEKLREMIDIKLNEATRNQLIAKSKSSEKGKQRFDRRSKSKVLNTTSAMNKIDMNKLFTEDILTVGVPVKGETDDYTVTISVSGIIELLRDEVKRSGRVSFREIARATINAFNKEDVYVSCNCLHPDTRVPLLDGSCPSVSELKTRYESGEKLYVYSVNNEGDFEPCEVENVWITAQNNTEFIEVTLDNGKVIRTTSDHRYMLRDGSFLEAKDLREGVSLMPLYFGECNGYKTVKFNTTGKYHSVYKEVANKFHRDRIELSKILALTDGSDKFNYDVAIHHKDFVKENNTPENLAPMSAYAHWYYHANLTGKNRPVTDRMREVARQNARLRNANPTPAMIEQRKKFVQKGTLRNYDEDRKRQQSKIMHDAITSYYDSHTKEEVLEHRRKSGSYSQAWKDKISESQKRSWETNTDRHIEASKRISGDLNPARREDVKNKISSSNKGKSRCLGYRHMFNGTDYVFVPPDSIEQYLDMGYVFKGHPKSEETRQRMSTSAKSKKYFRKPLSIDAQAKSVQHARESRWRRNINELLSNGVKLTLEAFENNKKSGDPSPLKYFSTFEEFIDYMNVLKDYNHKVVSVKRINIDPCEVYDIAVKDCHNFLVDGGVILHNCEDFSYRFGFFASKNDFNSGAPETRPSNITNPNDSLGSACKHVLLVLNNNSWIQRIARVISNYVHYMETHYPKMYADIIYPAIYGEEYQEPAQTSMFDDDTLDSDSDTLSAANRWRQQSTRFQKGNDSGIRFAKSNRELDNQLPIEENPDDIL